jgi:hypothetical protein
MHGTFTTKHHFQRGGVRPTTEVAPSAPSPAIVTAFYILTAPHYLATGYAEAGTVVTEGVNIPVGWKPTQACDPQNATAIQNYWTMGPPTGADTNYLSNPQVKPAIYWVGIPGHLNVYQLTGAGASLGYRNT